MIPTRIGQVLRGGTFTGFNRVRDTVYSIIVAPKSTEMSLTQKTTMTATPCAHSTIDGVANTNAMNDVTHPAAFYCKSLTVNEFADWYLPSKNELELCYRNLKPSNQLNYVYESGQLNGNLKLANGTNTNAIPVGMPYTTNSPMQTIVVDFIRSSICAFDDDWFWTSTECSSNTTSSLIQLFSSGGQYWYYKTTTAKVRGVRRELAAQIQE